MHIPPRRSRGSAQTVVQGHTRRDPGGADAGARTRGLDHGKVALYQLSYIRKFARLATGQLPVLPRGILLMNTWWPTMRSQGAGTLRCPKAENKKARNPLGSPGLCERWKEVRLRVSRSRTALPILIPTRPRLEAWHMVGDGGGRKLDSAVRQHRGGERKANPTRGAGQMLR